MTMRLNELSASEGAKKAAKRVGRGIGSGSGKTCSRGHKGQKSRSGGKPALGFEGGQMPLQRRLPKSGFTSRKSRFTDEVRLNELNRFADSDVDLSTLINANVVNKNVKFAKVIASGEINVKVNLKGIKVTRGARAAIEAAGGKVED